MTSNALLGPLAETESSSGSGAGAALSPDVLLVDAATLARILAIGERTLWRMLSAGKLPRPVALGSKMRRWRLAEIEAWTAAGCPSRAEWDARTGGQGGQE
jgi:predicted DNA-binding transcriptional regulator AlpA